jgi:hypothetical protein
MLTSAANRIGSVVAGTSAGGFQVISGNPNVQTNVSVAGDAGLEIIGFNAAPPPPPPPVVMPPMMQSTALVLINNCYVEGRQSCGQQPAEAPASDGFETLERIANNPGAVR